MIKNVVAFFVGVIQLAYFFPKLPERIASHFDGMGQPNNWQNKNEFVLMEFGFSVLLILMVIFLPKILRRIPLQSLNVPNKEYWLTGNRVEIMLRRIESWVSNLLFSTQLLMLVVFQFVFQGNVDGSYRIPTFIWIPVIAYLIYTTYAAFSYIRDFRKPN